MVEKKTELQNENSEFRGKQIKNVRYKLRIVRKNSQNYELEHTKCNYSRSQVFLP